MIILEPQAGLCNRMRAIASAYQLAKELDTKLCIVWLCNTDCMAKFTDLFQKIPNVELVEIPALFEAHTTALYQRWKTKKIMRRCTETKKLGLYKNAGEVRKIVSGRDVYIQSYGVWYPHEKKLDYFRPTEIIQRDIDRKKREFRDVCLGVHIRRTDNIDAVEKSGTELFITRMQDEIQNNPEVGFFVASDSEQEKKRIQQLFGERIVTNENIVLRRDSKIGMQNAVIDLFLLANCKKILGSAQSSYSTMAATLGNIECCTIQK